MTALPPFFHAVLNLIFAWRNLKYSIHNGTRYTDGQIIRYLGPFFKQVMPTLRHAWFATHQNRVYG